MKKQVVTENQQLSKSILDHWIVFKRHFLKAFTQDPISPEEEQEFLEVKSQISKISRVLNERLKDLGFDGEKISNILRQCISVGQLRAMPVPDRRNLYKEWHAIFISLNRVLGATEFVGLGWVPVVIETKTETSIASIKSRLAAGEKGKRKGKIGILIGVVVLVVAAVAVAFFMNQ